MRIDFNPTVTAELDAVAALIASLRGEPPVTFLRPIDGTLHAADEAIDPAAAFGAQSPEQAFPPAAAAPFAPPAIPVTAAPVTTPGDGTATPAAVIGSDNGPSAATASLTSGVELDGDGLPWDGRIHSGPADKKPKNADGTWRRKRGVDDATIASVTAALRQVMGAPAPAPAPIPNVPTPPPPVVGTESGPAVATTAPSFADLMRKITARQTAGTLTVDQTREISESLGLTGVRDLINRPDLVVAFDALLPVAA